MDETPGERLFSVIEHWLWQVADPMQLADIRAIRLLIDGLFYARRVTMSGKT